MKNKKKWLKPNLTTLNAGNVESGGCVTAKTESQKFIWAAQSTLCYGVNTSKGGITYNWGGYTPNLAINYNYTWPAATCVRTNFINAPTSACVS